jgi:hypothetical protein
VWPSKILQVDDGKSPDESERVAEALERIYQSSARKNRNEAPPLRLVEPPDDD